MNNYETWYNTLLDISNRSINTLNNMTLFKGSVVVFDIDDTLIHSNGYCINPIIDVFNFVKSIGVIPIIITNRSGDEKTIEFTKKQLQSSGIFGQKYIYFREPSKPNNPFRYKEKARLSIKEKGMTVIMSVGDKVWDIGIYAGVGILIPVFL